MASEERLPWLEAVDDEDGPSGISATKMATAIGVVLVSAAAVAGTMYLVGARGSGDVTGEPQLIEAPDAPYKVKPADPGGLDIAGESETAFATSAGEDPDAQLDSRKLTEAPRITVDETPTPAPTPPAPVKRPLPGNESKEPVTPTPSPSPAPTTTTSGPQVQLGSFSSRAQAEAAWVLLSSSYGEIGAMTKSITQAVVNGKTYYRVRGMAADRETARAACRALQAAGETCVVVN